MGRKRLARLRRGAVIKVGGSAEYVPGTAPPAMVIAAMMGEGRLVRELLERRRGARMNEMPSEGQEEVGS
jgi:hypothetical protein